MMLKSIATSPLGLRSNLLSLPSRKGFLTGRLVALRVSKKWWPQFAMLEGTVGPTGSP